MTAGLALVAGSVVAAPTANASTPAEATAARSTYALLNTERAANGLSPLSWSPALVASAHAHNVAMAAANVLSHQLPGERPMGARISAEGVSWHYAAENIGYTTNLTTVGANGLEEAMYREVAPNDGHRQNILSRSARYVGIDVMIGPYGKLWLTEDFADATGAPPVPKFVIPGGFNQPVSVRLIARYITSRPQQTNPTAVELNLRALVAANPNLRWMTTALGGHLLVKPTRLF